MTNEKIIINSNRGEYNVLFDNTLVKLDEIFKERNTVFLIDKHVWEIYQKVFFINIAPSQTILIDAVEENKDYHSISRIFPLLTDLHAKKNLTIVAIGGGIIQDIAGFIASILYRGIKWIYIPTTLLAQADSCIGAKTSINFEKYKNLLGTFWAPQEVWISTKFIDTLETKDFYSGIGEIIKLFLIDGETSMNYFKNKALRSELALRNNIDELIKRSLIIKKRFIEEDELDKGIRNILNFGHCIGHAIEGVTNYAIPHGQAVTLGMIWANIISQKQQLLSKEKKEMVYKFFLRDNHTIPKDLISFDPHLIISAMKKDKKREGKGLAIVLMDNNYNFSIIKNLQAEIVEETYDEFVSLF